MKKPSIPSRKFLIVGVLILVFLGGVIALFMGFLPISVTVGTGPEVAAAEPQPDEAATPSAADTESEMEQYPELLDEMQGQEGVAPIRTDVPQEQLEGILYRTNERVVNLADLGGYRYLRISIVLEFAPPNAEFYTLEGEERIISEETFLEEIHTRSAKIEDILTMLLTSKTFAEAFTTEGKKVMKEEILQHINETLVGFWVVDVYFTDFVIQ